MLSNNISRSRRSCVVVGFLLLAPPAAFAQGISGTVTDNTGGVLPGVTVTAASPALIEGERIAISDSQGLYSIVDLRPGVYTVTFTLPGFSTIIREGLELTTGFTANVDSAMSVGGIEETITVTGAAPTVTSRLMNPSASTRSSAPSPAAPNHHARPRNTQPAPPMSDTVARSAASGGLM